MNQKHKQQINEDILESEDQKDDNKYITIIYCKDIIQTFDIRIYQLDSIDLYDLLT
jgi:hypothetical protein